MNHFVLIDEPDNSRLGSFTFPLFSCLPMRLEPLWILAVVESVECDCDAHLGAETAGESHTLNQKHTSTAGTRVLTPCCWAIFTSLLQCRSNAESSTSASFSGNLTHLADHQLQRYDLLFLSNLGTLYFFHFFCSASFSFASTRISLQYFHSDRHFACIRFHPSYHLQVD